MDKSHMSQSLIESDDTKHLEEMRKAYSKRLRVRELQHALSGLDTPPIVLIEIEDLEQKIGALDAKLSGLRDSEKSAPTQRGNSAIPNNKQKMVEVIFRGDLDNVSK